MTFCVKCGKQLAEGARFCTGCGTPVGGTTENDGSKRVQKFVGEIRKCPSCGAVLESFQAVCSSCGFELQGNVTVATSVQKLMDKIAELESGRKEVSSNMLLQVYDMRTDKTDTSIANVIKAFPVPNTIEEILEFMTLAVTNMDDSALFGFKSGATLRELKSKKVVAEAWRAKMEQMYKKAAMSFASSPKFQEVKNMYNGKAAAIKKRKRILLIAVLGFILFYVILFICLGVSESKDKKVEAKETQRLEQLYEEIKSDISAGNYEDAELKFVDLKWTYEANYSTQKDNVERWKDKKESLQKLLESKKNQ